MANLVQVVFMCALIGMTGAACDNAALTTCTSTYTSAIAAAGTDVTSLCSAYTTYITCGTNADCLSSINVSNPCSGCNIRYSMALMFFLGLLQIVKRI